MDEDLSLPASERLPSGFPLTRFSRPGESISPASSPGSSASPGKRTPLPFKPEILPGLFDRGVCIPGCFVLSFPTVGSSWTRTKTWCTTRLQALASAHHTRTRARDEVWRLQGGSGGRTRSWRTGTCAMELNQFLQRAGQGTQANHNVRPAQVVGAWSETWRRKGVAVRVEGADGTFGEQREKMGGISESRTHKGENK